VPVLRALLSSGRHVIKGRGAADNCRLWGAVLSGGIPVLRALLLSVRDPVLEGSVAADDG